MVTAVARSAPGCIERHPCLIGLRPTLPALRMTHRVGTGPRVSIAKGMAEHHEGAVGGQPSSQPMWHGSWLPAHGHRRVKLSGMYAITRDAQGMMILGSMRYREWIPLVPVVGTSGLGLGSTTV